MSPDELPHSLRLQREARRIPGYEILRPIGRGSMGEVVLARQLALGREVAIKFVDVARCRRPRRAGRPVPPRGGADGPDLASQYRRPSMISASWMVSLTWSWSTSEGGISGARWSRTQPMPVERVLALLRPIIRALNYLHRQRHPAPGPQARERADARRRHPEGGRFRHRRPRRLGRGVVDPHRPVDGDDRLRRPGAAIPAEGGRARRPVLARGHHLRAADRAQAARGLPAAVAAEPRPRPVGRRGGDAGPERGPRATATRRSSEFGDALDRALSGARGRARGRLRWLAAGGVLLAALAGSRSRSLGAVRSRPPARRGRTSAPREANRRPPRPRSPDRRSGWSTRWA